MASKKEKELIEQIDKLQRYCTQYASREVNIHHALGITGSKMLQDLFEKADNLKSEITEAADKDKPSNS